MCLAIPARITVLRADRLAEVDIMGVKREVSLDLTPRAAEGDFVLVHAGFAIEVVSEEFAEETLELIRQFPELVAEEPSFGATSEASPLSQDTSLD
ncbi:MAG: HypC/HybG/HupF family hydrogenase formation chaperone [Coriobacteriaceae bacterium]|jgi:hydrogenase expression/formation protein HypC|nr:HypC/HybG/HupF family hydrogenase formation chaperone [Coriobacteriaceae bacterium]